MNMHCVLKHEPCPEGMQNVLLTFLTPHTSLLPCIQDIVLGASVHALYPAFGLPAVQPPPRITTTNIPLTPTASPHSTAPGGGTTLNAAGAARTASDEDTDDSDSSPVLPLPPLTRIRGRHTYTGSEPIPGLNNSSFSGARGPVPRSISSASAYALSQAPSRTSSLDPTPQPDTRYPTRTTSSTSGEKAICGSSDAAAVPLVTPPEPALRAPPPAPAPLTSPRWAVQAEVRLAVWDAEVEAWSPIYTQVRLLVLLLLLLLLLVVVLCASPF